MGRNFFSKKRLKETKLVQVSFKLKRLLFSPDVNLVTRHYRPEATVLSDQTRLRVQ